MHPNQTPSPAEQQKKKRNLVGGILVAVIAVYLIRSAMLSGGAVNGTIADPVMGPENAIMVIREYSDLQCPACRAAQAPLHEFVKENPEHVRLEFNDFPLSFHKNADTAAYAANCANDQGLFWEFTNKLFDEQDEWENLGNPKAQFSQYFAALGGDTQKFETCTDTRQFKDAVDEDIKEANKAGVNSTPTFFVNGERHVGALTKETWEAMLAELMPNTSTGPRK